MGLDLEYLTVINKPVGKMEAVRVKAGRLPPLFWFHLSAEEQRNTLQLSLSLFLRKICVP